MQDYTTVMSENSHTNTVHQAYHQYTRDREKTIKDPERKKIPQRPGNTTSDFTSAIIKEK